MSEVTKILYFDRGAARGILSVTSMMVAMCDLQIQAEFGSGVTGRDAKHLGAQRGILEQMRAAPMAVPGIHPYADVLKEGHGRAVVDALREAFKCDVCPSRECINRAEAVREVESADPA